jgi:ribonuclease BN (tRNA processing enzyme)
VKLFVLGVGDTFTEKHVTHALLVEHEGFRLAIDCPDSYRRVLKAARDKQTDDTAKTLSASTLDLFAIDDVLITHVHGDHMNGLEGVGYFKHFAQKKPLRLHTIAPVKEGLWESRLVSSMGRLWNGQAFRDLTFEDYFAWNELSLTSTTEIGPFKIKTRITKHHVPTSALFIEAGKKTLAISSDTAFDPELISEFLAPADVIVHETNYGPAHTAYADLLTVDADIKKKMRLIHYPDEFDIQASEIPALVEGQIVSM